MRIHYITGNGANPDPNLYSGKTAIIFHIVNNKGAFGSGFVIALNHIYGQGPGSPCEKYERFCNDYMDVMCTDVMPLGVNQYCTPSPNIVIVNMFAQDHFPTKIKPVAFDIEAFKQCLVNLKSFIETQYDSDDEVVLFSPRVGCGRGGAEWLDVEDAVLEVMDGLDVNYYVVDPDKNCTTI